MTREIVVLRVRGTNELRTALPALRALRQDFAAHHITLAAPAAVTPYALGTGLVDAVLPTPRLEPLAWQGAVDVAVNLHGPGPESHDLLRALHPARLIAFAHPSHPAIEGPEWRTDEPDAQRWCRLLESYGFPTKPARTPPVRHPFGDLEDPPRYDGRRGIRSSH